METGAIVAVTLQSADQGDTTTMSETLAEAGDWIAETAAAVNNEAEGERVSAEGPQEVVADKRYHSNAALRKLGESGYAATFRSRSGDGGAGRGRRRSRRRFMGTDGGCGARTASG